MTKFLEIDGDIVNVEHIVFLGPSDNCLYAGILSLSNGATRNILDKAALKSAQRKLLGDIPANQTSHATRDLTTLPDTRERF